MLGGGLSGIEEVGNSSLTSARWWIIRDRRGRVIVVSPVLVVDYQG